MLWLLSDTAGSWSKAPADATTSRASPSPTCVPYQPKLGAWNVHLLCNCYDGFQEVRPLFYPLENPRQIQRNEFGAHWAFRACMGTASSTRKPQAHSRCRSVAGL